MSGSSYSSDCPRCNGKETVMISSDYKPFEQASGICLKCGFSFYTKCYIADDDELNDAREDVQPSYKVLKKRKKGIFKDFDDCYVGDD